MERTTTVQNQEDEDNSEPKSVAKETSCNDKSISKDAKLELSTDGTVNTPQGSLNLVNEEKASKEVQNVTEETENEKGTEEIGIATREAENATEENSAYDVKNIHYKDDIAIYTDPATGYQYQWDKDKEEWVAANNLTYGFEDDTHTYTDTDGVKYFWDKEKSAWFPKINDDFMAQYQMNYGFIDNTTTNVPAVKEVEKVVKPEIPVENKGIKRKASEPSWFEVDETQNTKVYVSNLPPDVTEEEFVDVMQKCGLIMRDPNTGNMKIKLYKEPGTDVLKGDALCTYIRVESVDLALNLLDGSDFKGNKIKVERAKFQMKGTYDPKLKPKTKKRKEKQKLKRMQEKLFDWRPEKLKGERAKHERVVILKNIFEPSMFDKDVGLILEIQNDLREECAKFGDVRKVTIFDRHPEGVAQINMSCPEEADECVNVLNGRWFGKRQLTAEIWDGKTKFKIAETDAQISQRLDNWDKFLEDEATPTSSQQTEL